MSTEKKKPHEYPPSSNGSAWRSIPSPPRSSRSDSPTLPSPLRTSMQTNEGEDAGEEEEEELRGGVVLSHWTREDRIEPGNESSMLRRSVFSVEHDDLHDEGNDVIARSRSRSRTPTQDGATTINHWSRERVSTPPPLPLRELESSASWGREKIRTPPLRELEVQRTRESIPRPLTPVRHLSLDHIKPESMSHIARSSASFARSRSPSFDGYDMMMRKRATRDDDDETVGGGADGRRSSVDSSTMRRSGDALARTESDNPRITRERRPLSRESSLTALLSLPPNSAKGNPFSFFFTPLIRPPIILTPTIGNRYDNIPNSIGSIPALHIKTNSSCSSSFIFISFFNKIIYTLSAPDLNQHKFASDSDSGDDHEESDDFDPPTGSLSSFKELDTSTGPLSSFDERYDDPSYQSIRKGN